MTPSLPHLGLRLSYSDTLSSFTMVFTRMYATLRQVKGQSKTCHPVPKPVYLSISSARRKQLLSDDLEIEKQRYLLPQVCVEIKNVNPNI